jgi:hypothetical protein
MPTHDLPFSLHSIAINNLLSYPAPPTPPDHLRSFLFLFFEKKLKNLFFYFKLIFFAAPDYFFNVFLML